jgi:protoporphyrinogen oxidase
METEVLILGGGVAGLAAATVLKDQSIVLEREGRPGGLVRSECFSGFWFDRVLHLLYFPDDATKERVLQLVPELASCPPVAWVETAAGITRYPIQTHLHGLRSKVVAACLEDLARAAFCPVSKPPGNFAEMLEASFGSALCDLFMFPYNRKMWKRPLEQLAPSGFTWNITVPGFSAVLRGALEAESRFAAYNVKGWYPRPAPGSVLRGMEVLAHRLASRVPDLRLGHTVDSIDLETRTVQATHKGRPLRFRFSRGCLATLPLPFLLLNCRQTPPDLRHEVQLLLHNRVLAAMFSIRGPRPQGNGHWRYYADESLLFNRLIWMHEFDPLSAPADGWGLMAEITEKAEWPLPEEGLLLQRALEDIRRAGALPGNCTVIDQHLLVADPAYVVLTPENQRTIRRGIAFLEENDVFPLGRYGRWEYSSMGQVIRDGFACASRTMGRPTMATCQIERILEPARIPSTMQAR